MGGDRTMSRHASREGASRGQGSHERGSHEHRPNSVPAPWAGWILRVFFGICAIVLLLDFVLARETHHPIEEVRLIYPFFGFFGIALLIVMSKGLRRLVMRSEDYYDADR